MSLLERVLQVLGDQHVPHALIGAAALAAHGLARSTFDVDLLTTDPRVLDSLPWGVLRAGGAMVEIRRGGPDDPLAGVVRIEAPGERPVDLIVGKHAWQARAVERADHPPGGAPIALARDLVLLKLYAGGTQDLWDVRELLRLPGRARLQGDVEADLAGHPEAMRALWAEACR